MGFPCMWKSVSCIYLTFYHHEIDFFGVKYLVKVDEFTKTARQKRDPELHMCISYNRTANTYICYTGIKYVPVLKRCASVAAPEHVRTRLADCAGLKISLMKNKHGAVPGCLEIPSGGFG